MVRGGVAVAAAMALVALSACGGDETEDGVEVSVVGDAQPDVPSAIAWQTELEREADIVTVAGETLILTTDVEDRVWGLTTWRGSQAFEIDPASTPWDRGPLVAVAGPRVLLGERRSDDPGDRWMVAFDAAEGGQLWSVRHGLDDPRPVVIGNEVIVATRDDATGGIEGAVQAIALADGAQRWSLPLDLAPDEDPGRGDYDDTAPVLTVDGNLLAVRTAPSSVTIIDVADGREVGSFETDAELVSARPLEREGVVLVTEVVDAITARLHAVDAETVEALWTVEARDTATWVSGSALVVHGIERDYEAIRISDGELLWSAAGDYGRIIAESEGLLITDRVAALAAEDGDIVWSTFDAFTETVWLAPGVAIVHDLGEVAALDLVTGEERWSRSASVVTSTDGEVLLADGDRYLLVDGSTGEELWTMTVPRGASATTFPHADGTLFMSVTDDGSSTVLALQPPS